LVNLDEPSLRVPPSSIHIKYNVRQTIILRSDPHLGDLIIGERTDFKEGTFPHLDSVKGMVDGDAKRRERSKEARKGGQIQGRTEGGKSGRSRNDQLTFQTIKEALEPVDDITRGAIGELNKLHSRPQSERMSPRNFWIYFPPYSLVTSISPISDVEKDSIASQMIELNRADG
jgi:hypothetical protein